MVVVGDDLDLAPVDSALGVDLVGGELGRLRIEEPATDCASAITPILIGAVSAAEAGSAMASAKAAEAAPSAARRGAERAAAVGCGAILSSLCFVVGLDRGLKAFSLGVGDPPRRNAAAFALPMQADFSAPTPVHQAALLPPSGRACQSPR